MKTSQHGSPQLHRRAWPGYVLGKRSPGWTYEAARPDERGKGASHGVGQLVLAGAGGEQVTPQPMHLQSVSNHLVCSLARTRRHASTHWATPPTSASSCTCTHLQLKMLQTATTFELALEVGQ